MRAPAQYSAAVARAASARFLLPISMTAGGFMEKNDTRRPPG